MESVDHASESCPEPLKVFTLFPTLPMEVRLMIWSKVARSEARVVEFEWHKPYKMWIVSRASAQRSPPLYRVNKEARAELLHHCKIIQPEGEKETTLPGETFFPHCFFNPNIDRLYLVPGTYEDLANDYRSRLYNDEVHKPWSITNFSLSKLDISILKEARVVAVKYEEFWIPFTFSQYRARRPQEPSPLLAPDIRPRVADMYKRMHLLLEQAPVLEQLVFVLGDEHLFLPTVSGTLKLTDIGPGPCVERGLREWFEGLESSRPTCPSPKIVMKQASRNGLLIGTQVGYLSQWAQWAKDAGFI